MIPQLGQHVKCFLRNGNVVEGLVENWGESIVLKSLDGLSLMILHDPKQDIVLTKILLAAPDLVSQEQEIDFKIKTQAIKDDQPESDQHSLNAMTKAQLHIELVKQERKIIADKLKDHRPLSFAPRRITYGYPRFLQKPRP